MGESGCAWDRDQGWEIFDIQTLIEQFTDSVDAFVFFIATYDFLPSKKNLKLKRFALENNVLRTAAASGSG